MESERKNNVVAIVFLFFFLFILVTRHVDCRLLLFETWMTIARKKWRDKSTF